MPNYRLGIFVGTAMNQSLAAFRNLKTTVNNAGQQAQATRVKFASLGGQTGQAGQQAQGAKTKIGGLGNQTAQAGAQTQSLLNKMRALRTQITGTTKSGIGINSTLQTMRSRFINAGQGAKTGAKDVDIFKGSATRAKQAIGGLGQSLFSFKNLLFAALAVAAGGSLLGSTIGSNAGLEGQSIALSSILNANLKYEDSLGKALNAEQSWQKSLGVSSDMLAKFRQDAITSPGTSEELMSLFQSSLNPGLAAGANLERLRKFSNQALTVSKIMHTDIAQASSDIQLILTGNAGQDVKTFRDLKAQIGLTAQEFNKLPPASRLDRLEKAMRKFANPNAVREYSRSWGGLTSSLEEYKNLFFQTLGAKGFTTIKEYLARGIDWLGVNKKAWMGLATEIGSRFAQSIKTAMNVGQTLFSLFRQAQPTIQALIARAQNFGSVISSSFQQVIPFIRSVIQHFFELGQTVYNAVMPAVIQFWNVLKPLVAIVQNWLAENKVMLEEAWQGFKMLVSVVATVAAQVAKFIALGFAVVILGIARAVLEVAARMRMWLTEIGNIPTRMAASWADVKAGFLSLGVWLMDTAKRIPILGMLFGLVDTKFGIADKLQGELNRIKGQSTQLNQLVNDRVNQYNVSDPRAQYTASLRLAGNQKAVGGITVNANTTNIITTPNPVLAGQTAAKNTATTTTKAIKSIPPAKLGLPITAPRPK